MAGTSPQTHKRRGARKRHEKIVPLLCNVMGTLLIVGVLALAVALATPRFQGYQVYNMASGSMDPEIPLNSAVYVESCQPSEIIEDDIIAFTRDDKVLVRRVLANRTEVGEFVTKGDANLEEDADPVPYSTYRGRVVSHVPVVGKFMDLYASTVGRWYLVLALVCGALLNVLASRMRADQRMRIMQELSAGVAAGTVSSQVLLEKGLAYTEAPARRRGIQYLRTALTVVAALVFVVSAGALFFVTHERSESDRTYTDAADTYTGDNEPSSDLAPITVDFDQLRATNEDVVGWLYCAGTPINYPVLHGKTNDEYLRHDYTREYNINGSIFVDCDNERGFTDANTIIYGHHMNHGAMFATLEEWGKQSYYEEHPVMWLLTPTQDYQVVLVSGHHTSAYSDMYDLYHEHDEVFTRFLSEALAQSDFTPIEDATANKNRNYIMLTTCAYVFDNARYVIHGKLVPVNSAGGVPLG